MEPFFIVGPTSVGKTAAALELAAACGGEIVNADAFQVYAGLDLLTAKPTPEERRQATHHLLGSVPLVDSYNAARYLADATRCLDNMKRCGRQASVVGGSGLYVKAITHGLAPLPPGDPDLRMELEALDSSALLARLQTLDPAAAAMIDPQNKRRLVRAVEVCVVTGAPISGRRTGWENTSTPGAGTRGVFLWRDRAELHERINARVRRMFAQGVVAEVRSTPAEDIGPTAAGIIGLKEIRALLAGEMSLAACQEQICARTRQYARRQITWFKRETIFEPVNLSTSAGCARWSEMVQAQAYPCARALETAR